jgi:hypothetical protein
MGGVKDFLFGEAPEPQKQESGNHAYDDIKGAFSPGFDYFSQGGNMLGSLLGVGGEGAQTGALENFANSGGMKFLQDQGTKMITSSKAASGLLNSGSYGTALTKYGQGLASTYLNDYMKNLMGFSQLGLGAGNLVTQAGQYSTGTGQTAGKQGNLGTILQAASMIPGISDRRVKMNIEKIGEYSDGLGKYRYEFKPGHELPTGIKYEGVMADEVKELRPWAYLPKYFGTYDGVNYAYIRN